MILCEYECGREAKYQQNNGKWSCEQNYKKCPNMIEKQRKQIERRKENKTFVKPFTKNELKFIECQYCNKTFAITVFKQHQKCCEKNPDVIHKRLEQEQTFDHICEKCGKKHNGLFGTGRFCSIGCSKSRNHSEETRQKVSKSLTKEKNYYDKICPQCKNEFKTCNINKKYCSRSCSSKAIWSKPENKEKARKNGQKSAKVQWATRRSKNEIYFYELCKAKFNNVLTNEQKFNGWDADVIIEDLKIAVLWNGIWHYKKVANKHSILQVQSRDKIKIDQIIKCGYKPYVIKDMGKFNKLFVESEFEKFLLTI